MTAYIVRRILLAVPTLFGIVLAVFFLLHLAPGGPLSLAGQHGRVSREAVDQMRHLYKLDRPISEQFLAWMERVARFDLGDSFQDHRPVARRIFEALPYTLELNLLALFLTLLIAVPLGVTAAGRPGGAFDRVSAAALFALYSLPSFWVALLLMSLFSVRLEWLPLFGVASDVATASGWGALADRAAHLVLPVVCLTYGALAFFARLVRAGVAETASQDFVLAARARGASRRRALWAHAFRNALLPLVTLLGLLLPALLSGSVIIERIFAWPGLGRLYFDAILARDYPVVMGLTLFTAVLTLAAMLFADILYAVVDPRVRDAEA
jgi:peptide/nickel transport system permease protein